MRKKKNVGKFSFKHQSFGFKSKPVIKIRGRKTG